VIWHLVIGAFMIATTVAVQAELFNLFSSRFNWVVLISRRLLRRFANTGVIIFAVLYIMAVQTINVWLWALLFLLVGAFDAAEPALYFSLTSYTTLGFGDVTLPPEWRLLSGLAACNGFINFGWSTAYMVELVRKTA
jgi:hypothetical protein